MYEIEEQIIEQLEELDITFCKINATLAKILMRFKNLNLKNEEIKKNFERLFKIFSVEQAELEFNKKIDSENLNTSSNENEVQVESKNNIFFNTDEDDMSSSLVDLDKVELPTIFKNDENVNLIYKFIKEAGSGGITFDQVIDQFCRPGGIETKRLEIYLHLFISKNLIKCRGEIFYAN